MKNLKRIFSLALCGVLCVGAFTMVGCGQQSGSDDANTLDVYCYIAGYRDKWLTSNLDLFKEQDWVKEKYPDLKINYSSDSIMSTAVNKLNSPSSNKFDLLFTEDLVKNGVPVSQLEDITDTVYLKTIPGEDKKVIDKIPGYVLDVAKEASAAARNDGNDTYYSVKMVDSFFGMMYNNNVYNKSDFPFDAPPVTTDELIEQCEYVEKTGYTYTYKGKTETCKNGLTVAAANSYAQWMFPLYWMQYEGVEQYENYFNGYWYEDGATDPVLSPNVLTQKGRLRSLELIEDLFKNHSNKDAKDLNHTKAQTNFLVGNGLFHWNGDYFVSEMEDTKNALKSEEGIEYDIRYMHAPVLSSIVETLEDTAMTDLTLREVIKEIDKGLSYQDSAVKTKVSKNDYKRITEARQVRGDWFVSTLDGVIAKNSPAKELASDFLTFIYSDTAIKNFSENSYGLAFPVSYYENLSDEEYEVMSAKFDSTQKSKFDIMYRCKTYPTTRVPSEYAFALGKKGLSRITSFKGNMGTTFVTGTQTAKEIYEKDIRYWFSLEPNDKVFSFGDNVDYNVLDKASKSEWNNLLKLAGLN